MDGINHEKKIIMGEDFPGSVEDMLYLKDLVEAGHLKPVIDRCYALDERPIGMWIKGIRKEMLLSLFYSCSVTFSLY